MFACVIGEVGKHNQPPNHAIQLGKPKSNQSESLIIYSFILFLYGLQASFPFRVMRDWHLVHPIYGVSL